MHPETLEKPPVDEQYMKALRQMVGQQTDEADIYRLMHLAHTYGLDPLRQEVWLLRRKDSRTGQIETNVITTRDGYLRYAQQHAEFEGLISFEVCEGDDFAINATDYSVTHRFGSQRGKLLGAWAKVDRKGKKPFIGFAAYDEYFQPDSATWRQYPSAMIRKVAEVMVLKRAFGITGLVTKEELESQPTAAPSKAAQAEAKRKAMTVTPNEVRSIASKLNSIATVELLKSTFKSLPQRMQDDSRIREVCRVRVKALQELEAPATSGQLEYIQTLLQDHLISIEERFRMESALPKLNRARASEAIRRLEQALLQRRQSETARVDAEALLRNAQSLEELEACVSRLEPNLYKDPAFERLMAELRDKFSHLATAA
jgi:phage recombination protein Bet